jgi:fructokinase
MDIVAMGELLIDFTSVGRSSSGMRVFEQNPGGAPANVACCAAALGAEAGFIGKVGSDMHGMFLKETLEKYNVCSDGLVMSGDFFTTLAFVDIKENGERVFSFARKPGADTQLTADEVNFSLIRSSRLLSFGSLSLTCEPSRGATHAAVNAAREAGVIVAYDPNYRAALWQSEEQAKEQMRSVVPLADMIKISDEETQLLTGEKQPEDAAAALCAKGVKVAAVTLGAEGALVMAGGKTAAVPGFKCKAVDTTGAGDSFWGGFLYAFLKSGKTPDSVTVYDAAEFARFGNATAALCVQKNGAIPAMPGLSEVTALLKENGF